MKLIQIIRILEVGKSPLIVHPFKIMLSVSLV